MATIRIERQTVIGEAGTTRSITVVGRVYISGRNLETRTVGTYAVTINGERKTCLESKVRINPSASSLTVIFESEPFTINISSGINYIPVYVDFSQNVVGRGTITGDKTFPQGIITNNAPIPEWQTPIYDRVEGAKITATDMNRIAGNLSNCMGIPISKYNYVTNDFVKSTEWEAIIKETNLLAEALVIEGVTSSTRHDNINRIEYITKLFHEGSE